MDSLGDKTMMALMDVDLDDEQLEVIQKTCHGKNDVNTPSNGNVNNSNDLVLGDYFNDSFDHLKINYSQTYLHNKAVIECAQKYAAPSLNENITPNLTPMICINQYNNSNKSRVSTISTESNILNHNKPRINIEDDPNNISGLHDIDWNTPNNLIPTVHSSQCSNSDKRRLSTVQLENNILNQNKSRINVEDNLNNITGIDDIDWNTENVSFSQLNEECCENNEVQCLSPLCKSKVILNSTPNLSIRSNINQSQHNVSELNNSQSILLECKVNNETPENEIETNIIERSMKLSTAQNNSQSNLLECSVKSKTPEIVIEQSVKSSAVHNDNTHNQSTVDKYLLSNWGLPPLILQEYANHGITKLFQWQVECLEESGALHDGKNLIYSAPTSAGKTLVSEILMIKTVIEKHKKVLIILPFVSIVREKMFYFQDILGSSGIRVSGFMGSHHPPGGFQATHIAICTIEKANSIINRALSDDSLGDIGTIILDELHLVGDPDRGYILELLLTKVKYISEKYKNLRIQFIGMSATLPNLPLLGKWLDANLYQTDFRPIPLEQLCKVDENIYNDRNEFVRKITSFPDFPRDPDNVIQLCIETILDSCSVLIFCPTKVWCENLALQLSKSFMNLVQSDHTVGKQLKDQLNTTAISELIVQLKNCPVGMDSVLANTVNFGCAFHHAGLTMDERDIIEGSFKNNVLRVLVATSTLSSGVNLPARRVIIRTPIFHGKSLKGLTYRQMIGRAGRMGKDTKGESILICSKKDASIARKLMDDNSVPLKSCLEGHGKLERAILEVLASGKASSFADLEIFTGSTLFSALVSEIEMTSAIKNTIDFLIKYELVREQATETGNKLLATPLGQACLASSLPPEDGLMLFTELDKARQCFVLDSDLHMIYLVTPYSISSQFGNIDWLLVLEMWEQLSPSMRRVGDLVGVQESFLAKAVRGTLKINCPKMYHSMQVHKRFYTALALQELVKEVPLKDVAKKFRCSRGVLQSLQQSAATFAGMVSSFIHQLGWDSMEILISQFQYRLQFGIQRDLIDLMRLPLLNGTTARAIFKAGFETLLQLATADVCMIENILYNSVPFHSANNQEDTCQSSTSSTTKSIWINGKAGLTPREVAELLISHARKFLEAEMGLYNINWSQKKDNDITDTSENSSKLNSSTEDVPIILENENVSNEQLNIVDNGNEQIPINDTKFVEVEHHLSDTSLVSSLNLSDQYSDASIKENLIEKSDEERNLVETKKIVNKELFTTKHSTEIDKLKTIDNLENTKRNMKRKSLLLDDIGIKKLTLHDIRSDNENDPSNENYKSLQSIKDVDHVKKDQNFKASVSPTYLRRHSESRTIKILSKIAIVDATKSFDHFLQFCTMIKGENIISVMADCDMIKGCENIIGKKIAPSNSNIIENEYNCIIKDRYIRGFYIYCGTTKLYYLSLRNTLVDKNISLKHRLDILKIIFSSKSRYIRAYDCKKLFKLVFRGCQIEIKCKLQDPKVADWLLNSQDTSLTITQLIKSHLPNLLKASKQLEDKIKVPSNCVMQWFLCEALHETLTGNNICVSYEEVEMPSIVSVAKMELNGICLNCKDLQKLNCIIEDKMQKVQNEVYKLAGRRFNMSSSKEVAKVLGLGDNRKVSTNKQVLETLNTPISNLIIIWRKLNNTLTKITYPLLRSITPYNRLHGHFVTQTATGRIVMCEPNIQNVPKDFGIDNELNNLSCRSIFSTRSGYCIIAADYKQLEFRIMTHLSEDPKLCSILNSNKDIFIMIAAQWNNVSESDVNETMRQRTKQLIYSMIYGMSTKALAHTLEVSELEAINFLETFNRAYPVLYRYKKSVIQKCSETGFVETLKGRRRYLPNINQTSNSLRAQAERQAVNTTVQGSAADISKMAMVLVEQLISDKIPQCTQLYDSSTEDCEKDHICLILHMHDELIYEVKEVYSEEFIKILKYAMENAVSLKVPLPVNIKIGHSWGSIKNVSA